MTSYPDYYPKVWFGTDGHMEWIDAPLSGADVSPEGWGVDGTTLTGGGFVAQSRNSHKNYVFEWRNTSARSMAQKMQNYRDGVYDSQAEHTRGLLYFVDPLTYTTNMLPKIWASPSVGLDTPQFHPFGEVSRAITPENLVKDFGYPTEGVIVTKPLVSGGSTPDRRAMLHLPVIPVVGPVGYNQIMLTGASDQAGLFSNSYGVVVNANYTDGSSEILPAQVDPSGDPRIFAIMGTSHTSLRILSHLTIYVMGEGVSIYGMRLRYTSINSKIVADLNSYLDWFGGQGHSGCKIVGNPTYIQNNSVNGGQIGYAATLKEVGTWLQ